MIIWQYQEDTSNVEGFQLVVTEKFFLVQDMSEESFYTKCIAIHSCTATEPKDLLKGLADNFDDTSSSEPIMVYYGPDVKKVINQICEENSKMYLAHD